MQVDNLIPYVECKINLPHRTYRQSHLYGYGLIVTQLHLSYVTRRDKIKFLDVKGYVDLQGVLWPYGDNFKVIDLSPIFGTARLSGHLEIPPEQFKVNGFKHELLTVKPDNIIAIFLVYDANRNLLNQPFMPAFSSTSKKRLIEFIKSNKIDSVVIRGSQGPLNNELMKTELGVESENYLLDNGNDIHTVSKCKSHSEPFDLQNYKFGVKTPGMFKIFDYYLIL